VVTSSLGGGKGKEGLRRAPRSLGLPSKRKKNASREKGPKKEFVLAGNALSINPKGGVDTQRRNIAHRHIRVFESRIPRKGELKKKGLLGERLSCP